MVTSGTAETRPIVFHDNKPYYPQSYMLSFDKRGNSIHTAILHDLKANSIIYVKLENVKEEKEEI